MTKLEGLKMTKNAENVFARTLIICYKFSILNQAREDNFPRL